MKYVPIIVLAGASFVLALWGIHEAQWSPAEKLAYASALCGFLAFISVPCLLW